MTVATPRPSTSVSTTSSAISASALSVREPGVLLAPARSRRNRPGESKHHLETGRRTVQEVCEAVGYRDLIFFRDLFRRHTGLCPARYRERFGRPVAATATEVRARDQRFAASSRSMP
ncbi:MAG: helix-turn-helix domain-containing protein [Alphaproteobacteria bacterium]